MTEYICVIDTDAKTADSISEATLTLQQELQLKFIHKNNFTELDEFLKHEDQKEAVVTLLITSSDCVANLTTESLKALQTQYRTNIIVTAFEDPLKPLKKIETWPIENLIYKPFDLAILQEHIRFALIKSEKVKTVAVHSSPEKTQIEKIRRYQLTQLSEFGFTLESSNEFILNTAYKFYHLAFVDKKKSSQWAKPISKNNSTYEFIFCEPNLVVSTILRQRIVDAHKSKSALKTVALLGFAANKATTEPKVCIQYSEADDYERLKDFFARKFPKTQIFQLPTPLTKEKLDCDLLITENDYSMEQLKLIFKTQPLFFKVATELFKSRAEAEEKLKTETVRLQKPVDRNFLGRLVTSYFPNTEETDINPPQWFQPVEPALYSEMIEVSELSEAAFVYHRETALKHGDYQEFALTQDDENELRPIKAKIQFVNAAPDADKKYLHQIVFFGIREDLLKKLRLWMLQTHIHQKKSDS